MAGLSLVFYSFYLLISLVISGANAVNIQFYKDANFTELDWETRSNEKCNDVPIDKQRNVYDIRTDTCFIAYAHSNCESHWTETYMPGDTILSRYQLGSHGTISSFHSCNEEEGGNVEITEYIGPSSSPDGVEITKYNEFAVANVLESYKKVCTCLNVPQYVQNMSAWSIDNHNVNLLAYYEPNCSVNRRNSIKIRAGHNLGSRHMHRHRKTNLVTNEIQSFRPDPSSTYFQANCKLEILFNKFVQLQTQLEILKSNQDKLQNEMLEQHKDNFDKLTNKFAELQQQSQNFTEKIRSDLYKVFS